MANLSTAQLQTLKAAIAAETAATFVTYRTNGQTDLMAGWYNQPSTFVVYKNSVPTSALGYTINYVALAAVTSGNLTQLQLFLQLNPLSFPPTADIRAFFNTTFSGALGGQGQATRDALVALWKRFATRCEKLYATGTGSDASPGALVFDGSLSGTDISAALNS